MAFADHLGRSAAAAADDVCLEKAGTRHNRQKPAAQTVIHETMYCQQGVAKDAKEEPASHNRTV